ncbi:FAD-binding-3 domain-containing protein [Fusarium sp. Ph1]|nr:FAD-binding-3 domain-containing protein [Fusarium sp. Ph1]
MQRPFRIVIVGGGIAGMCAAIALRKDNREITILEQCSLNREIGAAISLQPNASKIVALRWDLGRTLEESGSIIDGAFEIYTVQGELQTTTRATGLNYPGRPATIRTSTRAISCDCDTGEVFLENGQTLQADLIVEADGTKSNIRRVILEKDVNAVPTGVSAYRIIVPVSELEKEGDFRAKVDPRRPMTTMVVGHDRRLIMGPCRGGTLYSIVALVPDGKKSRQLVESLGSQTLENMNESSGNTSWASVGSKDKMLETFSMFSEWEKKPLKLAKEAGLWQLRDLDPLETWYRGRAVIIGDVSHAMLPTQGQGASQAVEDAEALGAFFDDIELTTSGVSDNEERNKSLFSCRFERASTIQAFSRQSAKPATEAGSVEVKINMAEFLDYNCNYEGALDW